MQFDRAGRWIWRQRVLSCFARRAELDTQAFDTTVAQGISGAGTLAVGDISHFSATLGGGPVSVAAGANLELGMEA
jgi:hypothetical protein